jgi:endonuclease/exonuclease/phosphatase family metal-dependent hydrolase
MASKPLAQPALLAADVLFSSLFLVVIPVAIQHTYYWALVSTSVPTRAAYVLFILVGPLLLLVPGLNRVLAAAPSLTLRIPAVAAFLAAQYPCQLLQNIASVLSLSFSITACSAAHSPLSKSPLALRRRERLWWSLLIAFVANLALRWAALSRSVAVFFAPVAVAFCALAIPCAAYLASEERAFQRGNWAAISGSGRLPVAARSDIEAPPPPTRDQTPAVPEAHLRAGTSRRARLHAAMCILSLAACLFLAVWLFSSPNVIAAWSGYFSWPSGILVVLAAGTGVLVAASDLTHTWFWHLCSLIAALVFALSPGGVSDFTTQSPSETGLPVAYAAGVFLALALPALLRSVGAELACTPPRAGTLAICLSLAFLFFVLSSFGVVFGKGILPLFGHLWGYNAPRLLLFSICVAALGPLASLVRPQHPERKLPASVDLIELGESDGSGVLLTPHPQPQPEQGRALAHSVSGATSFAPHSIVSPTLQRVSRNALLVTRRPPSSQLLRELPADPEADAPAFALPDPVLFRAPPLSVTTTLLLVLAAVLFPGLSLRSSLYLRAPFGGTLAGSDRTFSFVATTANLYQGVGIGAQDNLDAMAELLLGVRSDIVALQETETSGVFNGARDATSILADVLHMAPYHGLKSTSSTVGAAILSSFPVLSREAKLFDDTGATATAIQRPWLREVVSIGGVEVEIWNVHLEYLLIEADGASIAAEGDFVNGTPIDGLRQAAELCAYADSAISRPIILMGDLNAPQDTPVVQALEACGFDDVFTLTGGYPATSSFPGKCMLTRPGHYADADSGLCKNDLGIIDHVMIRSSAVYILSVSEAHIVDTGDASDHNAVSATIELANSGQQFI